MERPLDGRLILIAEDEPLIALHIQQILEEEEGARVLLTNTLDDALRGANDPDLCAAILDHKFKDGDSSAVCERLNERSIPFVLYSGLDYIEGPCEEGVQVKKPASISEIVTSLKTLLASAATIEKGSR
jgi:DNA-binding response OmpR family regulator